MATDGMESMKMERDPQGGRKAAPGIWDGSGSRSTCSSPTVAEGVLAVSINALAEP